MYTVKNQLQISEIYIPSLIFRVQYYLLGIKKKILKKNSIKTLNRKFA